MNNKKNLATGFACMILGVSALAQTIYNGNGDTGFGGAVGTGSVTVSDDGTDLTFTLNRGSGDLNDDLVIYIDSVTGGFTDTSVFSDNGDGGRSAISGYDGSNRSVMTFTPDFSPDYAISLQNGYASLFQLQSGGANSFAFITGASQSGGATDSAYSLTIGLSQIGLTPGAGQSIELFGTYVSTTAYRSTEAVLGNDAGTQGNNPFSQTSFVTYATTAVPEPSSLTLCGLTGLAAFLAIRRRR